MALPAPIRLLLRPAATFARATTYPRLAVVLVLAVAVLHAGSVAVVAGAFTDVAGTVTVENPDYVPEWVCESRPTFDETSEFGERFGDAETDCSTQEYVERDRGNHAEQAVSGYLLQSFAGVLVCWPVLAWLVHLVATPGRGGYWRTLLDTSWAVVPLALPALARLVVVPRHVEEVERAGGPDGVADAALGLTFGPDPPAMVVVSVLAALWCGYVAFGVAAGSHDTSRRRAVAAGAVVAGALLVGVGVPVLPFGPGSVFLGALAVGGGAVSAAYARELIVHDTRWDLLGMRGSRVGEPARWRVLTNQFLGVAVAAGGVLFGNGVQVVL